MHSFSKWLDNVCEITSLPRKNFVYFDRWFVNERGDLLGRVTSSAASVYTIYYCDLTRGKNSYKQAEEEWVSCLMDEEWINEEHGDIKMFRIAFNLAWSKSASTDKSDPDFIKLRKALNMRNYGRGVPCSTVYDVPEYEYQTTQQKVNQELHRSSGVR